MVDFQVFDSLLDSAFVVDRDGRVVYCNEPAASFCQSSARRINGKLMLTDLIGLAEDGLLPFTPQSPGYASPSSFIETKFNLKKSGHHGTCQVAVRALDDAHWAFFIRDVSLEEALHGKYRSELAQKEAYARNLEHLVEVRTAELRRVNQTLNAILNSLGQGFFTFDAAGTCGPVFTKACETVLEGLPANRPAAEVLGVPAGGRDEFAKWSEAIFQEYLPFEDMRPLGPSDFPHSNGKRVTLEYYPLRAEDETVAEVVVVATDRTAEYEARAELEIERQYASMIVKYTRNKDQFTRFLATVTPAFDHLISAAAGALSAAEVNDAFRLLHTLEGEAGTFSIRELRTSTRECQQVLEPVRAGRPYDDQARAEFGASLVRARDGFLEFLDANHDVIRRPTAGVGRTLEIAVTDLEDVLNTVRERAGGAAAADAYAERLLNEPIEGYLSYFDSLAASVADKLGKRLHPLRITGGDLRIYAEPYQPVFTNLVHAFRNAVDHGLETPIEREFAGKDPAGTINVDVRRTDRHLVLTMTDDGRGIDPAVIRARLKTKFPAEDADLLSDHDVIQAVCRPGFSSRDAVGEFSGRGVGLDALREEVLRLGGTLNVKSKQGEGTAIEVTLPFIGREPARLRSA